MVVCHALIPPEVVQVVNSPFNDPNGPEHAATTVITEGGLALNLTIHASEERIDSQQSNTKVHS